MVRASGRPLADLAGALPVDLQKHEASGRQRIADRLHAGAVEIVVHLGVLQELAAAPPFPGIARG